MEIIGGRRVYTLAEVAEWQRQQAARGPAPTVCRIVDVEPDPEPEPEVRCAGPEERQA